MIGELFVGLGVVVLGTASGALTGALTFISDYRSPGDNARRGKLGAAIGGTFGFGVGCLVAGWVLS